MQENSFNSLEREFIYYADIVKTKEILEILFGSFFISSEKNKMEDIAGIGKTVTATKELLESLGVTNFTNPILTQLGLWSADSIKQLRERNVQKALIKFREEQERRQISVLVVDPKFFSNWLEGASLEEDENLRMKWVELLLSEISEQKVHPDNIEILKSLSSIDAKILDAIFEITLNNLENDGDAKGEEIKQYLENKNIFLKENEIEESIERFITKGICQQTSRPLTSSGKLYPFSLRTHGVYLTKIGTSFMKSVTNIGIE